MSWGRVARRIRVPLGFLFAVFYFWRARPNWASLAAGAIVVAAGVFLRAMASGHVKKNEQLADDRTLRLLSKSPVPWDRSSSPSDLRLRHVMFGSHLGSLDCSSVIYVPVIRSEEAFLRQQFAEYDAYARHVPRLLPHTFGSRVSLRDSRVSFITAASRVQCIDRGRRNAGGSCCEDALVSRFMGIF